MWQRVGAKGSASTVLESPIISWMSEVRCLMGAERLKVRVSVRSRVFYFVSAMDRRSRDGESCVEWVRNACVQW